MAGRKGQHWSRLAEMEQGGSMAAEGVYIEQSRSMAAEGAYMEQTMNIKQLTFGI